MVAFCCGEGGTGGGNLTFNLQQIFPPANDNFEDATWIDFPAFQQQRRHYCGYAAGWRAGVYLRVGRVRQHDMVSVRQ